MSIKNYNKKQVKLTEYMSKEQQWYWEKIRVLKQNGSEKMANVRDEAKAYEPKTTKNVSNLDVFNITADVYDGDGTTKEGKPFKYKFVVIDDEEYRVPLTVLSQIKTHLEEKPDLTEVKVKSQGKGLNTEYTVIPVK